MAGEAGPGRPAVPRPRRQGVPAGGGEGPVGSVCSILEGRAGPRTLCGTGEGARGGEVCAELGAGLRGGGGHRQESM